MMGGYAGGQAEYVRVPFADVGPIKVPGHLTDEQVLFLSDIFPTGYMAAENCNIEPGDTVAVWGCGPVGLFCIKSAFLLGAGRVIAIDDVEGRLGEGPRTVRGRTGQLREGRSLEVARRRDRRPRAGLVHRRRRAGGARHKPRCDLRPRQGSDVPGDRSAERAAQAIMACRKGGTVSIPGVYGGLLDKLPMGAAFAKGLTFKMGQTHVHKYLKPLLERIENGRDRPVVRHHPPVQPVRRGRSLQAVRDTDRTSASRWCSSRNLRSRLW